MGQVDGKVALVTGGASGIGEACAVTLAREGARVVISDIDDLRGNELASAIDAAGHEAVYLSHDVTDETQWQRVVAEIERRYGRLDVLVANAGIGIMVPSIIEMSLADWRRQTAVNLDGVFLSVKHCIPLMRASGGGSIIMTSSIAGLRLGDPGRLLRDQGRGAAVREGDRDGMRLARRRHPGQQRASRHYRHADLGKDPARPGRRRPQRPARHRGDGPGRRAARPGR